ncbi:APC family permease [Nocardioides taihuensis]|uniref:APC family permease n=1 Tax=Nocardioides taihuensis TaxID=1835606 RepID=A0ABW0BFD3_9ACTN
MAEASTTVDSRPESDTGLKRSITGRQLFFYTLGDVLGSGIYVLIGLVAAAVGGAFWIAFAVGVTIAAITGTAYAELVTKYPRAAGAALYVNKAFGSKVLTFLVTVSFLSASFAAAGSLASGFTTYFAEIWPGPPALLVSLVFVAVLTVVNFIGITESVVINMLMAFVEILGLVIVMVIGAWYVAEGSADFGVLGDFSAEGNPTIAILAGVALSFFAMTGFENTANVAEETVDPHRSFPRSLIGGMVVAGVIYVLVSIAAALTVDTDSLVESEVPLLEVVKSGVLPISDDFMATLFAVIAMVAITNTTLVAVVTQPRILYGMANEDVVPGVFARIHATRRSPWVGLLFSAVVVAALLVIGTALTSSGSKLDLVGRLAAVTVLFLLFIYALVIVSALKLRGQDEDERAFRANTALLVLGLVGNLAILAWTVYDDPTSLLWCAGLVAVGVVLFVVEHFFGRSDRPEGTGRGDPSLAVD